MSTVSSQAPTAADSALDRASWQPAVFADRLRRADLLKLKPSWPLSPLKIQVHRNQPFDLVAMAARPFLQYAGFDADFTYSDYDDSLQFSDVAEADLHVVSVDFERYETLSSGELVEWFASRVRDLRTLCATPILVTNSDDVDVAINTALQEAIGSVAGVYVCDVAAIAKQLGDKFRDERSKDIKATTWSDQAILQIARAFSFKWIAAVAAPPLKAIAVDLDNTLYDGVLGEDGLQGVRISGGHVALQEFLVEQAKLGVFVGIVSRNEESDVRAFIQMRDDFALKQPNLAAVVVNWNSKSQNIAEFAHALHISPDAMLFVDDNAGELANVVSHHPGVRTIHATAPEDTMRALQLFPGVFRFEHNVEDALRTADIVAAQEREAAMQDAGNAVEYLASLQIQLSFRVDDVGRSERMQQLTNKTNQFNTALARTSEQSIVDSISSGKRHAVTVRLADRLSDSGTIAFVYGFSDGKTVTVEELTISCRALGRELEDPLIFEAVRLLNNGHVPERVCFKWTEGPRNGPALEWLRRWVPDLGQDGVATLEWQADLVQTAIAATHATITMESNT